MLAWFRRRSERRLESIARRIAREEGEQLVERIRVAHQDPLAVFEKQRGPVREQLLQAANVVGQNVLVGRGVVMWGGKFAGGLGIELHDRVRLFEHCVLAVDQVSTRSGIVLEEGVAINVRAYLDGSGGIRVGKGTILGPNVVIVSSGHRVDAEVPIQSSGKDFAPVDIGANAWIGANVVILKGITIGDGAVIGAGAVVTRDIPGNCVAAGNPAAISRAKRS